ncbi:MULTISPECIES: hypothetical protein [unclassified Cupriavidus]|uniref:hypothetical protein n=1 Tax=unclassified Cupriavidus TaxID=2640874 RepID=UPI00313F35AE
MAAKPKIGRVTEPGEGEVHGEPDALSGNVTLCGLSDFIGAKVGESTNVPVTCAACISIFEWCNKHRS